MPVTDIVRDYYENYDEWGRFDRHSVEFEINRRFINRYIKPGDGVLDIGGGPGRYALELARRGCDVTLFDLTPKHLEIAKAQAAEMGVPLQTVCGDACCADTLVKGLFDAVLLMGPLYHLPEEADRVRAVEAALNLLKPGGILFAAFINSSAVVYDYMTKTPERILNPEDTAVFRSFLIDSGFSGPTFTFIHPRDVEPFMTRFPLRKLHLLGSESILLYHEKELIAQPPEVWKAWLDLAEQVSERKAFLPMAGHFLYIGQKI